MKQRKKKRVELAVGDKVELMWPRRNPQMRIVGTCIGLEGSGDDLTAVVRHDETREPHRVLLSQAKVSMASQTAKKGLWMRRRSE